jgi:hypothetical protein
MIVVAMAHNDFSVQFKEEAERPKSPALLRVTACREISAW